MSPQSQHGTAKAIYWNTGAVVPAAGLGTFQSGGDHDVVNKEVEEALNARYRHVDAAIHRKNEREVGVTLERSSIPTAELFVTTKLFVG